MKSESPPPRKHGEPFAIEAVTNNRQVLAYETALKPLSDLRYLVLALGCGHEYSISHKCLMETRLKNGAGLCRTCSRKRPAILNLAATVMMQNRGAKNKRKDQILLAWKHPSPKQAKILWAHSLWSPTNTQ